MRQSNGGSEIWVKSQVNCPGGAGIDSDSFCSSLLLSPFERERENQLKVKKFIFNGKKYALSVAKICCPQKNVCRLMSLPPGRWHPYSSKSESNLSFSL